MSLYFKLCGSRIDPALHTRRAYGNEKLVGEGIRRSGVPRSEIFVSFAEIEWIRSNLIVIVYLRLLVSCGVHGTLGLNNALIKHLKISERIILTVRVSLKYDPHQSLKR